MVRSGPHGSLAWFSSFVSRFFWCGVGRGIFEFSCRGIEPGGVCAGGDAASSGRSDIEDFVLDMSTSHIKASRSGGDVLLQGSQRMPLAFDGAVPL
jgi:hypothetical protein